jgi:hypothetical protein
MKDLGQVGREKDLIIGFELINAIAPLFHLSSPKLAADCNSIIRQRDIAINGEIGLAPTART